MSWSLKLGLHLVFSMVEAAVITAGLILIKPIPLFTLIVGALVGALAGVLELMSLRGSSVKSASFSNLGEIRTLVTSSWYGKISTALFYIALIGGPILMSRETQLTNGPYAFLVFPSAIFSFALLRDALTVPRIFALLRT